MSKIYKGWRLNEEAMVRVTDGKVTKLLDTGYEYVKHSPTGFEWGYGGSGPAQLAFAILLDASGDVARSMALYQNFKAEVISNLDRDMPWAIAQDTVVNWMRSR